MNDSRSPLEDIDPIVRGLLPGYLERRDEELQTLQKLLANDDFEKIRILGHNLSGSGGAYGLQTLTEIGRRIETAAGAADSQALDAELDNLAQFLQSVRTEVA